jgi:hypothetical protein
MNTSIENMRKTVSKVKRKQGFKWNIDSMMEEINTLIQGHGVECYDPESDNSIHPKYLYVNSGDCYRLTVIFNTETKRFIYSDIGTIIERYMR